MRVQAGAGRQRPLRRRPAPACPAAGAQRVCRRVVHTQEACACTYLPACGHGTEEQQ